MALTTPEAKARLERLKAIRTRTDLKLPLPPLMNKTYKDLAGRERDLVLRYYQIQGALHLASVKRFLLGDDTGLGKCKPLSALVSTDRGLIPLGELAPQGALLQEDTFYPLDKPVKVWTGWEWADAKAYYHSGRKPMVTVTTRRGYSTSGSLVHPLWTRRPDGQEAWTQMQELQVGDFVAISIDTLLANNFFYDEIVEIKLGEETLGDLEIDHPRHAFVADGFINHNTIQAITALCLIWQADTNRKVIISTTRSATGQWAREFTKFTHDIPVFLNTGTPKDRAKARAAFQAQQGPCVLLTGYRAMVQDFRDVQGWRGYILILDEVTVVKNEKTQVGQVYQHLSCQADRCWGLTATLLKNRLVEGFSIIQNVVCPGHFQNDLGKPISRNKFFDLFCLTKLQKIPGTNRQIPVVVGHTPEHIRLFREIMDPIYIGRPKHEVAADLPTLTTEIIEVDLSPRQCEKYAETLDGLLTLGEESKETTALTSLIYCQQIVNHLGLLGLAEDEPSPKIVALMDLLTEGDLADEKIIVYTRFKSLVDLLMETLAAAKVPAVRITGDDNDKQREKAMLSFQDPKSTVRVLCLTSAGTESLNLQAAKAIVCMDTPWSAGEFLQLLGRMIRIGSEHERVLIYHLLGRKKSPSGKRGTPRTIDHHVLEIMQGKMELLESVLGQRLKGIQDSRTITLGDNDINEILTSIRNDR